MMLSFCVVHRPGSSWRTPAPAVQQLDFGSPRARPDVWNDVIVILDLIQDLGSAERSFGFTNRREPKVTFRNQSSCSATVRLRWGHAGPRAARSESGHHSMNIRG